MLFYSCLNNIAQHRNQRRMRKFYSNPVGNEAMICSNSDDEIPAPGTTQKFIKEPAVVPSTPAARETANHGGLGGAIGAYRDLG